MLLKESNGCKENIELVVNKKSNNHVAEKIIG
jgi:hypothetical protein